MRLLSVGPEICRQLPSDSTSRWTPLLFSYTFPTTWACWGLAPLRARPWRANQKKITLPGYLFLSVLFLSYRINMFLYFFGCLSINTFFIRKYIRDQIVEC